MGCDYSKRTKSGFDRQTADISQSIDTMKKQQDMLKHSIEHLDIPTNPIGTIEELKNILLPHLERIETLLQQVKDSKELNNSFNQQKSLENLPKNKFQ